MKLIFRLYRKAMASMRESSALSTHLHPDGRTARALRRERERAAKKCR